MTAELASAFSGAAEQAGLQLRVHCPPLPEPVWVDRDMWEKVVFNLLSNAVKFTLRGTITVAVGAHRDGGAQLTVTDTGIGVPAAELPALFERFHQVAGARGRSAEGSGIGLALVRELVVLHGGTIRAASEPGAGTTFTVRLPAGHAHLPTDQVQPQADGTDLDRAAASAAAAPFVSEVLRWLPEPARQPASPELPAPDAAAGPPRILVADDNADMRDYLVRLLRPRYRVDAVLDGAAALRSARADPPDLILSDVMMPELDGIGLLTALRADSTPERLGSLIFLSAVILVVFTGCNIVMIP